MRTESSLISRYYFSLIFAQLSLRFLALISLLASSLMRISPRTIRQASKVPLLKYFLAANRTLENAKQELKWVQQELPPQKWTWAAKRRLRLVPLQYILGSQPFGELTILCKENVLIPRWETEEWVGHLLNILEKNSKLLKVVDVCTGTGCIPLAIKHKRPQDEVCGIEVSETAIELCKENLALYSRDFGVSSTISFLVGNVFQKHPSSLYKVDLLTANPPYIPREEYNSPVALNGVLKSVKKYEPQLALIGDLEFYDALISNYVVPLEVEAFVFEVGDEKQVKHVQQKLQGVYNCGSVYDSQGKIRCVAGWKNDQLSLDAMCS